MIYVHRDSVTAVSGSVSSSTLRVKSGLCQHFLVRANTATTVFRVNLVDENSVTVRNYGFHQGEISDVGIRFPMVGNYTLNITNASPNDTFTIMVAVDEG